MTTAHAYVCSSEAPAQACYLRLAACNILARPAQLDLESKLCSVAAHVSAGSYYSRYGFPVCGKALHV